MATILGRARPDLTTFVIAGAHALVCFVLSLALVVPAELADDDARALAGWPITAREIAIARLIATLRPILLASIACVGAPLIAYAIVGPIALVSAVLLAVGIALQAIAIPSATLAFVAGLVRVVGRTGARRVVVTLAALALLAIIGSAIGAAIVAPPKAKDPMPEIALPALLPPAWAAAWGVLGIDARAPGRATLGLLAALACAPLALRLMARRGEAAEASRSIAQVRSAPLVAILSAALAPLTPGREGWVVRRVLAAHARDDWRHGLLRLWPILVATGFAAAVLMPATMRIGSGSAWFTPTALAACALVLPAIYAPLAGLGLIACSSTPDAAWIVAQGDLDPSRTLAAVRGIVRGICLMPLVVLPSIMLARLSVPAAGLFSSIVLATLTFELSLALFQQRFLVHPFSRKWQGEPDLLVLAATIAITPIAATVVMVLLAAHRLGPGGVGALALVLGSGFVAARRALARRIVRDGLRLELAPAGDTTAA
jgi:hypothetical protein